MKIAAAAGEKAKLDRQLAEVSDLINRLLAVSHLNATPASCRKLAQQGAQLAACQAVVPRVSHHCHAAGSAQLANHLFQRRPVLANIAQLARAQPLTKGFAMIAHMAGLYHPLGKMRTPRRLRHIAAGSLLVALYTLSDFATPEIMHLDTFTRMIYVEYNAFGLDRAALMSLQLLVLVVCVLVLEAPLAKIQRQTFLRWQPVAQSQRQTLRV